MFNRPATVTAISWLVMLFSLVVVATFLLRVSTFAAFEITSISLVTWWFTLGLFPLYFTAALFMLRGKSWSRELCIAAGVSAIAFGVVILPFNSVICVAFAFVFGTATLLYLPLANAFFHRATTVTRQLSASSFLMGVVSVGLAATAAYARSTHDPASGTSLKWLTKMGLVTQTTAREPSFTEASIFAVNDTNALVLLTALAVVFAAVAMVLALVAEYRREPTLYLSAGYTCGTLALVLFKPLYGFAGLIAGIVTVIVLRRDRESREET